VAPPRRSRPRVSGLPLEAVELLESGAAAWHPLTPDKIHRFDRYWRLLDVWSRRMNLGTLRSPLEVVKLHFLDSLSCLQGGRIALGASVIDVGSGAGFPGVPLKIARPDLKMALLDASRRRVAFLELLVEELGLEAEVLFGRAEVLGHAPDRREAYDVVVSRATAPLPKLAELCLPFAAVGGVAILPKGPAVHDEIERAEDLVRVLGGRVDAVEEVRLPGFVGRRNLAVIRKVAPTPAAFPRRMPGRRYFT